MTFDGADISAGFVKLHNVRGQVSVHHFEVKMAGGGDVTVASFGVTGWFWGLPAVFHQELLLQPQHRG